MDDPTEVTKALLQIAMGLRNNLFHGLKWQYRLRDQFHNFSHANAVLMAAIDLSPPSRRPSRKYAQTASAGGNGIWKVAQAVLGVSRQRSAIDQQGDPMIATPLSLAWRLKRSDAIV